jgi:hypothetical protein
MKKLFLIWVFVSLFFFLYTQTLAEVPQMINYQGKLTTATGGCLNDTVQMTFSIYPDTMSSPADWTETQDSVVVKEGIFNVLLGSVNPIADTVFDGSTKYLGVQVESDPEMRPRKPIASVGYSYKSLQADTAKYSHCLDKGPVMFEGADNCDSSNRARIVILTPSEGYSSVKLYLFAESSVMYDRATFANTTIGDLPSGIVVWSSPARTGPGSKSYNCGSGAPSCDPSPGHTHSIGGIYIHSHEIDAVRSCISRTDGSLPSNVSLWIDGIDRTSSISWTTQNPTADKEIMVDGEEILGWVSSPGVHWIEIGTTQVGRVRFLIYAG